MAREAVIDPNGPDPIDVVTSVLEVLSLCTECVVLKTRLPREKVVVALKVLLRMRAIDREDRACDSCRGLGAFRCLADAPRHLSASEDDVQHTEQERVVTPPMPDRAALVTAVILERPTCEECITEKTGLTEGELQITLNVVRVVLRLREDGDRCRGCGEWKRVLSLERPGL